MCDVCVCVCVCVCGINTAVIVLTVLMVTRGGNVWYQHSCDSFDCVDGNSRGNAWFAYLLLYVELQSSEQASNFLSVMDGDFC